MISDQDVANEERRTTDAATVALAQLGYRHHQIIVRTSEELIQITVWRTFWQRLLGWGRSYQTDAQLVELAVRSMLACLDGPRRHWSIAVIFEAQ